MVLTPPIATTISSASSLPRFVQQAFAIGIVRIEFQAARCDQRICRSSNTIAARLFLASVVRKIERALGGKAASEAPDFTLQDGVGFAG